MIFYHFYVINSILESSGYFKTDLMAHGQRASLIYESVVVRARPDRSMFSL